MKNKSREIRLAQEIDLPGVQEVLTQNLIKNKKLEPEEISQLEKTGFFIVGFTDEEAKAVIADQEHSLFLVLRENQKIVGFIMGCDFKKLPLESQKSMTDMSEKLAQITQAGDAIFYLQHLAKKQGETNVGTELSQALVDQLIERGYQHIICRIAEKPIQNKASIQFHYKKGFACLGYLEDGEASFGVYWKAL